MTTRPALSASRNPSNDASNIGHRTAPSQAEILRVYEAALVRARVLARRLRLDRDDCESEAGLAVAEAAVSYDPARAAFRTWAMRKTEWGVRQLARRNRRYKNSPYGWFDGLVDHKAVDPSEAACLDPVNMESLAAAGATRRELMSCGLSDHYARRLIKKHRPRKDADAAASTADATSAVVVA